MPWRLPRRVRKASRLIAGSFPANDDRETLAAMVDALIEDDALDVGIEPDSPRFVYPSMVLAATKR